MVAISVLSLITDANDGIHAIDDGIGEALGHAKAIRLATQYSRRTIGSGIAATKTTEADRRRQ